MRIGILTGGGDVPGLNACIKAVVNRAAEERHQVVGIRRGWGGSGSISTLTTPNRPMNLLIPSIPAWSEPSIAPVEPFSTLPGPIPAR